METLAAGALGMTSPAGNAAIENARHAPQPAQLRWLNAAAESAVAAALIGELCLVIANAGARLFLNHSFLWVDEAARFALSILAFIGGAVAYQRRDHAFVRLVLNRFGHGGQRFFLALADLLVLLTALIAGYFSLGYIDALWAELTPVLQLPAALIALPMPIGMALIALHAASNLWNGHGKASLAPAAFLGAAFTAAIIIEEPLLTMAGSDAPVMLSLLLFFAAILAGVPVGFVLLLATSAYLWAAETPLSVLPQTMINGIGNFILLAIPFFIFAGLLMERGGISERLVRFVYTLAGHLKGGLLQVTVVSMYIVSGLSGSKPADVAAVGTVMRDKISERHGRAEGAAVLAATAIMGETVPPSIAMLIVGSITNVSLAAMFLGGLVPAAVIALCLMALIYFRARQRGDETAPRAPLGDIFHSGLQAFPALLMPLMLLGGILFGVATPTEVAGAAVLYGLLLGFAVYRKLTLEALLKTVVDTAALTGVLLFIFAASSGFSWSLTVAYLPQRLVETILAAGSSPAVFLISSIFLLIVAGVLLEGLPSLNVLAPLLIPIASKLGVNDIHYALVLIIAMGAGGFMPLAGVGFYVCCAIMRCDVEAASRAMLPYLAVILGGLIIVALVPSLSLFLPRLFGFAP
jgi:tripartite ATP-independent transporter DctM subunit